jgi:hypothetical protein
MPATPQHCDTPTLSRQPGDRSHPATLARPPADSPWGRADEPVPLGPIADLISAAAQAWLARGESVADRPLLDRRPARGRPVAQCRSTGGDPRRGARGVATASPAAPTWIADHHAGQLTASGGYGKVMVTRPSPVRTPVLKAVPAGPNPLPPPPPPPPITLPPPPPPPK